ncbi:MurR/RpiR family transcriptional regulator [Glutamicibacter sp. TV12E]|uniref:MurR/RpiR family transcriptional regulator n=1 Tax=Glutamicibacter sp. TV12E TaxID=3446362 RepID=UPI00403467E7
MSDTASAAQSSDWHGELFSGVKFTKSQQRVIDALSMGPKFAAYGELTEVATRAGVNSSTVVRTAQALGYSGWSDFQRELRAQFLVYISHSEPFSNLVPVTSPVHDSLAQDHKNLEIARSLISAETVDASIEALCTARRILCLGQGSHGAPSLALAHLAAVMGYPATHEQRSGVHLAAALNSLGPGDVVFITHLWRPISELGIAARIASERSATVISITDLSTSPVAKHSTYVLPVPSEGVFSFQSATAALSVVYGLLAGMEAHESQTIRPQLEQVNDLWDELGVYDR